ncbi:uncharacterized protein VTP21DRAFT_2167 [Calcarisporiella thermophila]|uniref:uncharacterized protein n=1 Tax=Calcarisporiella thermophila TaxID=911321 RepID=UPI003742A449
MRVSVLFSATIAAMASFALAEDPPCTAVHNGTDNYYDLSPLKKESGEDWIVSGADLGYTFRINVCRELLYDQTGLKNPQGVAAYQRADIKGFSIGKVSTKPFFRGDKLLLEYQDGDECPNNSAKHRSTLISFTCNPVADSLGKPIFVGQYDDCAYWFEWHTSAACPTKRAVGGSGWGLFFTIREMLIPPSPFSLFLAFLVYFIGGIAYNRIIHHERGIRQVPHWEFWANAYDFCKDMALILIANLPCFKERSSSERYRGIAIDEENALIDEDEEEEPR